MVRKTDIDSPIHELLSRISTQIELLPRLRDGLAEIVAQLDEVLSSTQFPEPKQVAVPNLFERAKRHRGPGKKRSRRSKSNTKFQPKGNYIDEIPANAVSIPGYHKEYTLVPGLGIVSAREGRKIRLLRLPQSHSWGLRDKKGVRLGLSLGLLERILPQVEVGL